MKANTPTEIPALRNSIVQSVLWLGSSTFLGQFISWLSTIVVIRLLSPADYGLFAMTNVFTSLVLMLGQMGISSALVQKKDLTERETRQVLAWTLISGAVGTAVTYALAPLVARFYREPAVTPLVRVLGLNVFVLMLYVVPQSLFIRKMNFKLKAKIDFGAQLASVVATLVLAVYGMGVWALVAGLLAVQIVKAIVFNLAQPRLLTPLFDLRGTRRLLTYGLMVTADRLLNFVYTNADMVIVGRSLGNTTLGLYSVAMGLAEIPLNRVLPIVTQVSFASFSRLQNDPERIRSLVRQSTHAVAFAAFPIFYGMAAVAPFAVPLLLGPRWAPVIVPFQLMCLVLPLKALGPMLPPVVFAIGRPAVNVINVGLTAVAMTVALLVGVRFGVTGVLIAWLTVYPVVFLITTAKSLRAIGLPTGYYLAAIRFPFVVSALMLAAIEFLGSVVVTPGPAYSLVLFMAFGLVFYGGLVLMFRRDEYAQLRGLLRR
jgi:teichuronic acid exporter